MEKISDDHQPTHIFKKDQGFETLLEHWAKARIDTPLQIVSRFDEAAKQLIAIGGTLQGLFIAVFAFSSLQPRIDSKSIIVIVILLAAFTFCAARVICTLPPKMEAMGAYELFRKTSESGISYEELTQKIDEWCKDIERLASKKHKWLIAANILFLVNLIATLWFVFCSMKVTAQTP